MCFKQIAVLITGIALFVAHRSGAAALPGVLLNLGRWLIITSTFTFIFALYKVLIDARDGDMSASVPKLHIIKPGIPKGHKYFRNLDRIE